MRELAALCMVAALSSCTTTPREAERAAAAQAEVEAELSAELEGLTPGDRSVCLPEPTRVNLSTKGYGPTIVYVASRNVKYRNDTTGGCERLGRGDTLVTVSTQSRPCRGDIARTVDRTTGFQTGSCALGDFVTYRRP